jgi:hypothetical protein
MECQNCVTIQECKKPHYKCSKFKLFGTKPLKPKKSRDLCSGCNNNWYNQNKQGKCWSYSSAKVKLQSYPFHLNHRPPWQVRWQLSCFVRKW